MTGADTALGRFAGKREPWGRLLLMAAWFGLLTGLARVCILTIRKLVFHQHINTGPDYVWMTPAAELSLLVLLGVALALLARRWPRVASLPSVAFVFALVSFLSLVLMYPRLHELAAFLLAAGLAAQTARTIAAHPRGFHALTRRTMGWITLFVVTLGLAVHAARRLDERHAWAALPPPPPSSSNVLLIVLDTVRAQSLRLYGYERPTGPQLARFAATGVRFERALSTAPWTLPSHASMFTGRWPHELTADWQTPLDDTHPVLAEVLSARGYRTAGFVANVPYGSHEFGLHRGFTHYEDYHVSPGQILAGSPLAQRVLNNRNRRAKILQRLIFSDNLPLGRKTAPEVNRDFLDWLDHGPERPFFVFLNYMEAHEPYDPPPPFDVRFGSTKPPGRNALRRFRRFTPMPQQELPAYEGCIGYLDEQLGRLLEELRARGALDNTLVIVTSDHGEQFGEHGLFMHNNSLYMPLLHVPLLISFPGHVPAGARVADFVTLRDLPATVLDLLGIENAVAFPGSSLARFWRAGSASRIPTEDILLSEVSKGIRVRPDLPFAKGDMKSLVIDGLHYIKNGDGVEELYDLNVDPSEERNLAESPQGRAALVRFRAQLETSLAQAGQSR